PFDDDAGERLNELVPRLAALGFRGRVVLTAELAPFCLTRDRSGMLALADPDLPLEACELLGHPLQDAGSVTDLQSVGFADAMTAAGEHPHITVELAAGQALAPGEMMPSNLENAGAWNRLAARANRVHVALLPAGADTAPALARNR